MNAYNFTHYAHGNGTVFYRAYAESEARALELANASGCNVEGLALELDKTNIKDECGKPYPEGIAEAVVR